MWASWNWLGVACWTLVVIILVFVVHNIRQRRLKMLVTQRRRFSWPNFLLDMLLIVIVAAGFGGMIYATFLHSDTVTDKSAIQLEYRYRALVLQTRDGQGYFVRVHNGSGHNPIQTYTYWTQGAKYQINSPEATISTGKTIVPAEAAAYPWPTKTLAKVDQSTRSAFVATVKATYKNTPFNGLGMHAGRPASYHELIRLPSDVFVYIDNPATK
ncbi:LVIS_2131 family protein [Schleiferilactobacillus shenzhenensis]|uniref:DUF4811 domain-containing protein n=1 Tax=Schleiferilactobacillus shenzhenensis LY-73 TaxID=1231336 RepID=U4TQR2_9LACO|nr:LVIS_2131 family protein [Schleiferilactobacillus shenzhenensis]ERL64248.1 hypothetical protein L248_1431 [Schleiferilactobacillus shenzhenensis LY-73]